LFEVNMAYSAVNGFKLSYEERGQGGPLLLVPGALGTGLSDFGPQLKELASEFRIIAPDMRGYGQSRPPQRDFPRDYLQRDANDMLELMAVLDFKSFSVAGWSDGASTAVLMAITNPQCVSKLVVWGGSSYISREDLECIEKTRSVDQWPPSVREPLTAIYGDTLQSIWSSFCDWAQEIYGVGGELYKDRLHLVRCPTLIFHGEKDPLVPGFHARAIHRGIVGSQLHLFPQGRHNLHITHAREFNAIVKVFLAGSGG
jgi:valacyclovir hydrolase